MTATAEGEVRKGRKYDQVMEGALRVFLRDGYDGASVDDIAREAGVSKATLYAYFPDKNVLFRRICATECRRQTELAEAELDPSAPVEQQLTFVAERIAAFLMSDFGRNAFRLVTSEGGRFPDLAREFWANGPGLTQEKLAHHLKLLTDRGLLRVDDPNLAAEQFSQLCKAHIHDRMLFGMEGSITPEGLRKSIRGAVEMFLARYGVTA